MDKYDTDYARAENLAGVFTERMEELSLHINELAKNYAIDIGITPASAIQVLRTYRSGQFVIGFSDQAKKIETPIKHFRMGVFCKHLGYETKNEVIKTLKEMHPDFPYPPIDQKSGLEYKLSQ